MKLLLFFLAFSILVFSCKKEKTRWESEWSAPLISDTLSLNNLVNDTTLFDDNGVYSMSLKRTLLDFNVSELIEIPDTTINELFTPTINLPIAAGVSFVNSVEEHELNIPEVELKKIILKEGFIDVRLENPIPTKTLFTVNLPGVTKSGIVFNHIFEAPAMNNGQPGIVEETVSLAGYSIDLTGITGGEYNILRSKIEVKTDPSGPSITLSTSDVTKVFATFRNIKIDYARGFFGSKIISDTSINVIEALGGLQSGTIDFPQSVVRFEIENGIKVNANAKLLLVSNENNSGDIIALNGLNIGADFNLNSATGSWNSLVPSYKVIEFNAGNSNMESYLENLGTTHNVGYSMQLNPWGNTSGSWDEIFSNSRLRIGIEVDMPLQIGLDNLIVADTFAVTLNQEPDKSRIKSGELILETKNAFPFSAGIKIHFLGENNEVLYTTVGTQEIISSLMGEYDSEEGMNIGTSNVKFTLSSDALNDINDVKFIIVEATFNSINPITSVSEQVNIPVGAFLAIKLKTNFISENIF
tara:strand:+ start:5062 stop:6642 length:1581 start_codon:yes stop_codon:yes gene_type:complete